MNNSKMISFGTSIRNSKCDEEIAISKVLDGIMNGVWKDNVEIIRSYREKMNGLDKSSAEYLHLEDEKSSRKSSLPWFNMGLFNDGIRKRDTAKESIGLIIDLDHVNDPESLKEKIKTDSRVFFAFVSPSGDGLKIGFMFDKHVQDAQVYSRIYKAFSAEFAQQYNVETDKTSDISRACFVSYDPAIFIADQCDIIVTENYEKEVGAVGSAHITKSSKPVNIIIDGTVKNELNEMAEYVVPQNYDEWVNTAFSLNNYGEDGREAFLIVSRNNETYRDPDEVINRKFDSCRNPSIPIGYFINLARSGGYEGQVSRNFLSSYCEGDLFLLPVGTDINSFFFPDEKRSQALLFNEIGFRKTAAVNSDVIKRHKDDYLVFSNGVWKQVTKSEIERRVRAYTVEMVKGCYYKDPEIKRLCNFVQNSVEEWDEELARKHLTLPYYLIITRSYIYKIDSESLQITREANKGQYYNFLALPDFDIDIENIDPGSFLTGISEIDDFLVSVSMNDTAWIKVIQEIVGYAVLYGFIEPKIYFGIGSGSNGKSVFTDLIKAVVGHNNVKTIEFGDFDTCNIAAMEECFINIPSELSIKKTLKDEILKALADGNTLSANEKYLRPRNVNPVGKLFAFTNTLPTVFDSTDGFWRRSVVIPFDMKIKEDDRNKKDKKYFSILFDKHQQELRMWALNGLMRLIKQRGVHSKCDRIYSTSTTYRDASNSVALYIKQLAEDIKLLMDSPTELHSDEDISIYTFHNRDNDMKYQGRFHNDRLSFEIKFVFYRYKYFCSNENCHPFGKKTFIAKLKELCERSNFELEIEYKRSNGTERLYFNAIQLWESHLSDIARKD